MVDALKLNGLDTMYGVAGIPVTDLARLAQAKGIRYIGFRHEQSAGNAAAIAGYLTQKPGICLTVSAPGFLNGMVALANATTNGFPMIQISGSSDRAIVDLQQGDYEELDQMNAAKPYAKAAYRVNRAEDIGIGLARAIRAASPAVLAACISIFRPAFWVPRSTPRPQRDRWSAWSTRHRGSFLLPSVERALELLARAERPLIILGKGAAYAQADADIRAFIEQTGIPFLPDVHGQGPLARRPPAIGGRGPLVALAQADVVMLIGARLNWLLGHGKSPQWSPTAQFVQLDIPATEMDSNRAIAAPVVGDIASSISALLASSSPTRSGRLRLARQVAQRKQNNVERMATHLAANPDPMDFYSALGAIKGVLANKPEIYLVNEGANTLDITRNVIDMREPRKRLDCGTWG